MERHRRSAARLALYASLLLVGGAAWAFISLVSRPAELRTAEQWLDRDYAELPEVKLLQQYVQIDTSETTGDEVAGARFLARQFEAAGIPARIEIVGKRRANLYALLEGEDKRPLVLHNHIDVEPVNPAEWKIPPFSGRIELPWIHGRGTFDMKSVAIAQMLAMIDLKKSGAPIRRSVLFLGTSSEERGSRLGVRRILQLHPEMVRGFWAVLTEGGVVEARARDDIKFWGTEVAQKHYADLIVCDADRERLEALRTTMQEMGPTETDLLVTPEVRAVLAGYGQTRDRDDLVDLVSHPEKVVGDIAAFRKLPKYIQSMLRNEAVAFSVKEAPGGGYQMVIKFQLLPGQELADVREKLVPSWLTFGMTTLVDAPPTARTGSPTDHAVYQAIDKILHETYPEAPTGPYFLPWTATDARFFRTAGVPTYGFSPFLIMNTDTLTVDRANERFALPGFVSGVEIYRQLLRRLASDT